VTSPSTATGLGWLLTRFAQETPLVSHVLAISADGLALAVSEGLPPDRAEQLAAVGSGLAGLTLGAARLLGATTVHRTVVDMEAGLLLVVSASDRAHLIVLAAASCDLGTISYETAVLARRVGTALTPETRKV
jgi:uncharacterized protein